MEAAESRCTHVDMSVPNTVSLLESGKLRYIKAVNNTERVADLRNCVKVKVAVSGSRP